MNVTRRSDGSFSTYMTTPGGQTEFKDYTPGDPHSAIRDWCRPVLFGLGRLHFAVPDDCPSVIAIGFPVLLKSESSPRWAAGAFPCLPH